MVQLLRIRYLPAHFYCSGGGGGVCGGGDCVYKYTCAPVNKCQVIQHLVPSPSKVDHGRLDGQPPFVKQCVF